MRAPRDYDDIPGTYVQDAVHLRKGYHLNMFCLSLNHAEPSSTRCRSTTD